MVSWESPLGTPIPSNPLPACKLGGAGLLSRTESFYGGLFFMEDLNSPHITPPTLGSEILPRTITCLVGGLSGLLSLPHEESKLPPLILAGGQVLCN